MDCPSHHPDRPVSSPVPAQSDPQSAWVRLHSPQCVCCDARTCPGLVSSCLEVLAALHRQRLRIRAGGPLVGLPAWDPHLPWTPPPPPPGLPLGGLCDSHALLSRDPNRIRFYITYCGKLLFLHLCFVPESRQEPCGNKPFLFTLQLLPHI